MSTLKADNIWAPGLVFGVFTSSMVLSVLGSMTSGPTRALPYVGPGPARPGFYFDRGLRARLCRGRVLDATCRLEPLKNGCFLIEGTAFAQIAVGFPHPLASASLASC